MQLTGILNDGKAGDTVALHDVDFGNKKPWGQFIQPAIFRIVGVSGPEDARVYDLHHLETGITYRVEHADRISHWLYPIADVIKNININHRHEIAGLNDLICHLRTERNILMEVLKSQGIRVITEEQAKVLGLK